MTNRINLTVSVLMAVVLFFAAGTFVAFAHTAHAEDLVEVEVHQEDRDEVDETEEHETDSSEDEGEMEEGRDSDDSEENPVFKLRNRIQDAREDFSERTEEARAELQERKEVLSEETRERLAEKREEIVNKFVERFVDRLEKFLDRNTTLLEKLEERIDLIEEKKDIELTDAREALNNAWVMVADAEVSVANLEAEMDSILENYADGDKGVLIAEIREAATEAKDAVKAAHSATVEVIRAVKASLEPFIDRPAEGEDEEDNEDEENEGDGEVDESDE